MYSTTSSIEDLLQEDDAGAHEAFAGVGKVLEPLIEILRGLHRGSCGRFANPCDHSVGIHGHGNDILHDLVEIDAGDNPIFGDYDAAEMEAQEQIAADRIFGLLPADLRVALRSIWEEFEAAESPSARFAKSLDRFQPPMQNLASGGGSWTDYNVSEAQIEEKVGRKIAIGAPALWSYARARISSFFAGVGA